MELVTVSHCARTILNVTTGAIGMRKVESIGKHSIQLFFDKKKCFRGKCQLHFHCDMTIDHECRDCYMRPGGRCGCMYGTPYPDLGK